MLSRLISHYSNPDNILDLNEVLGAYKEQVVCNIANPYPHLDLGVIVQVSVRIFVYFLHVKHV